MLVTYTQGADGHTHADIHIEIEVLVWGMASMLEGFMADTAAGAFTEFMEFTQAYLSGGGTGPRPGSSTYAPSEVCACRRRPYCPFIPAPDRRGGGGRLQQVLVLASGMARW
jgi:hypothetical protein